MYFYCKVNNKKITRYLRPSEDRQEEAIWRACSEVIWRCGGGFNLQKEADPKAIVALPGEEAYVQHSSYYYQDNVTEKVVFFCSGANCP